MHPMMGNRQGYSFWCLGVPEKDNKKRKEEKKRKEKVGEEASEQRADNVAGLRVGHLGLSLVGCLSTHTHTHTRVHELNRKGVAHQEEDNV